jgi:hypothetical protein
MMVDTIRGGLAGAVVSGRLPRRLTRRLARGLVHRREEGAPVEIEFALSGVQGVSSVRSLSAMRGKNRQTQRVRGF